MVGCPWGRHVPGDRGSSTAGAGETGAEEVIRHSQSRVSLVKVTDRKPPASGGQQAF